MKKTVLVLMAIALVAVLGLGSCSTVYYDGPTSDHFNGKVFLNPVPRQEGFLDFLKWRFGRDPAPWPEWVDIGPTAKPPARIEGDDLRVTFVNHATVLIQTRGLNILTDPHWSERASPFSFYGPKRVHAPGVAFEDLPKIDAVLVSHNHYDHFDLKTLQRLYDRDRARIFFGLGNDAVLAKYRSDLKSEILDWQGGADLAPGVRVHFQYAKHWSARGLFDRNRALWGAFVIETPGGNIYHAGDTGYSGHFRKAAEKFGGFRLALLPVGHYAPRWFMHYAHINPEEAVQAHKDLRASHSLGMHLGTFPLTDEAREEPEQRLQAALRGAGVADGVFRTLKPGQAWPVPHRASP